jgi:hypothetical protein
VAGTARQRLADGEPDERRLQRQQAGPDPERRLEERQQGHRHRGQERRAHLDHDQCLGSVGQPGAHRGGPGRLRHDRGQRVDQHGSRGLGRVRCGAQRLRAAGVRGQCEHQVQRHLQHRRCPQSLRRLDDRDRGAVRREGDDHAALGLPHEHLLRPALLQLRRGLLPAVHLRRRALLLPGAPAVLLVLLEPPSGCRDAHGGRRRLPHVQGRQLQQADDDQRRQDGLPVGACAPGGEREDAARRAGARHRGRHDVLPLRERLLPSGDERRPGELRGGDAARRGRVRAGAPPRLQGRAAQHDVLRRGRSVLRSLPFGGRQGAVRDGGHSAAATRRGAAADGGTRRPAALARPWRWPRPWRCRRERS